MDGQLTYVVNEEANDHNVQLEEFDSLEEATAFFNEQIAEAKKDPDFDSESQLELGQIDQEGDFECLLYWEKDSDEENN